MKYLVRSVKYFFYFAIITSLIVTALVMIGAVEGDIDSIFRGGYSALWKIAIFFAIVAAVYPKVGFITRDIPVDKDWDEIRETAVGYFRDRRYDIESESASEVTFRLRGAVGRLTKMNEDRLTLRRTADGYTLEGLRKDVLRLAIGLEHRLTPQNAD
jgi:hypothetical protein